MISVVGSETPEFAVHSERAWPIRNSVPLIAFSIVWLLMTSFFIFSMFGPLLQGQSIHFELNGVPTVASPDNLKSLMTPAIMLGVFVLIGLGLLAWGLRMLLQKGGYFVGTPTRLVHYQDGNIRSIDWEQFTGHVEVSGNNQKGSVVLQMRTGRWVSNDDGPKRYTPDYTYLVGIPSAFDIEQICRKRIKENDPTPVKV